MGQVKSKTFLAGRRAAIASKVRQLRQDRRWGQAELAKQLGLSQSRLSEIERGAGSFSAEQLLLLLSLFNVSITEFAQTTSEPELALQNALARLGASHLHEAEEVLLSEQLADAGNVIREALVSGAPRIVVGAALVLVLHARRLNLRKVHNELSRLGYEHRLPWLIENTLQAFLQIREGVPRRWVRATSTLQLFIDVAQPFAALDARLDVLDPTIRTKKTMDATRDKSSAISQRWGIVTALLPDDFVEPLRSALEQN